MSFFAGLALGLLLAPILLGVLMLNTLRGNRP